MWWWWWWGIRDEYDENIFVTLSPDDDNDSNRIFKYGENKWVYSLMVERVAHNDHMLVRFQLNPYYFVAILA